MSYEYLGDATAYDVVVSIQKEKHGIIIQLFRAHTSEPYGELQVPKSQAKRLSTLLNEYAGVHKEETQTSKENT